MLGAALGRLLALATWLLMPLEPGPLAGLGARLLGCVASELCGRCSFRTTCTPLPPMAAAAAAEPSSEISISEAVERPPLFFLAVPARIVSRAAAMASVTGWCAPSHDSANIHAVARELSASSDRPRKPCSTDRLCSADT